LAVVLRHHPANVELRDAFSRRAATLPAWWVERATNCLEVNTDAGMRTELWMQLASLHLNRNDKKAALEHCRNARTSVVAAWNALAFPNQKSRSGYGASSQRVDYRDERTLVPAINEILEDLLQIEAIQLAAGDTDAAQDTLLMAMKSVEMYPRNYTKSYGERPESPREWLPKLAGHLQLRQHGDLAELILDGRCWSQGGNNTHRNDKRIVANTAAAAEDQNSLENLLANCRREKSRLNQGEIDRLAFCIETHLAILAAKHGNAEGFQQKALAVGGYARANPNRFPQGPFLPLIEPAVLLGKLDVAKEYLRQTQVPSVQRDHAAATLAVAMVRNGQAEDAKSILREIRHPRSIFRVRMALAQAEAQPDTEGQWRNLQTIDKLPDNVEKAAAYAGIAMKLMGK
jgi:hypothetical protein